MNPFCVDGGECCGCGECLRRGSEFSECEICGEPICMGDEYFNFYSEVICTGCAEQFKRTAGEAS